MHKPSPEDMRRAAAALRDENHHIWDEEAFKRVAAWLRREAGLQDAQDLLRGALKKAGKS